MRRLAVLTAVLAGLALAACGDDDSDTTTTPAEAPEATDTGGAAGSDMTAGEYMEASLPDEIKTVKDIVAANPDECADADPKPGGDFQVSVAIRAAEAAPETSLAEIVVAKCLE
jgi:hypothetical protein